MEKVVKSYVKDNKVFLKTEYNVVYVINVKENWESVTEIEREMTDPQNRSLCNVLIQPEDIVYLDIPLIDWFQDIYNDFEVRTNCIKFNLCEYFLENKEKMQWFIEQYFGFNFFLNLIRLAKDERKNELYNQLNKVWFDLPGNKFNIIENPEGFNELLNCVEL